MSGRPWTEQEYRRLFGTFPPNGGRPSRGDFGVLAREFDRSVDAVSWQWEDGASYVTGRSASTTSDALKSWLDREVGR